MATAYIGNKTPQNLQRWHTVLLTQQKEFVRQRNSNIALLLDALKLLFCWPCHFKPSNRVFFVLPVKS